MPRLLQSIAAASFLAAVACGLWYGLAGGSLPLALCVTFGTTAYHFIMRLFVGLVFSRIMKNRGDYRKGWYRIRPWEEGLYRRLRVKSWKGKLPSYDPNTFSPKLHTWEEIAGAMCQAELVHETIVLFSFLPVLAAVWLGEFWVFFLTSLFAAAFDLVFVMAQRYNRQRILKLCARGVL